MDLARHFTMTLCVRPLHIFSVVYFKPSGFVLSSLGVGRWTGTHSGSHRGRQDQILSRALVCGSSSRPPPSSAGPSSSFWKEVRGASSRARLGSSVRSRPGAQVPWGLRFRGAWGRASRRQRKKGTRLLLPQETTSALKLCFSPRRWLFGRPYLFKKLLFYPGVWLILQLCSLEYTAT